MEQAATVGVLLGGGQSRRMGGGDKCLRSLGGTTLLGHVIARLRPQVGPLILNANGNATRFAQFQVPVVADAVPGFAGPLAGVLTGMDWAAARDCPQIVTVATDAPFLPLDLVARLSAADADIVFAASAGRLHPVIGLWPVRLRADLRRAVVDEGIRRVVDWSSRHRVANVTFSADPVDPFFNVNTEDDLREAGRLAALTTQDAPPR